MNKNLYRVIFNKARGMLMVVAEIATSHGGISLPTAAGQSLLQRISALTRLRFALLVALGCVSFTAGAGIVADGKAPRNQQPTIISAADGTPQINIQTPSAGGVSRNLYSQFDVDSKGAVLNNSHGNTQTQLAGMVTGNPWLAKGEAKIILNEVNASRASQLNGFIEVAGQKAQIVIANPAGITCDGCGFINAHRATLTTGQAQISNGLITGYDVERGEIVIQGAGLDSKLQDKTDLIARAVKVNAGLWANELNVTTGRNKVDAEHQSVTVKTADGSVKPTLAIDVAQLGGMYANKIRLRGTEAGVGVHNAGDIGAAAGSVTIDANGMLTNTGSLTSSENITLAAQDTFTNQGKIFAEGNTDLQTTAKLINSGSIAAAQHTSLNAASIDSTAKSVLAAGISSTGKPGTAGNLTLSSKGALRASGQNIAAGQLTASGTSLDFSDSQTSADKLTLEASSGDIALARANITASQQLAIQTRGTLNNDGGRIAADKLTLTASKLSNRQGVIQQTGEQDLQLSYRLGIDNSQGEISSNSKNLTLQAPDLNNEQGKILHFGDGSLTLDAAQIAGSYGTILSNGALGLESATLNLDNATTQAASVTVKAETLSNRFGKLLQSGAGEMMLTVAGQLDNQDGTIASNGAIELTASDLINQRGKTIVTDRYSLRAILSNELQNSDGVIASGGDLTISSKAVDNRTGVLQSGGALSLNSQQADVFNDGGTISSAERLMLTSGNLTNDDGQILAQDLRIESQDIANQSGTIKAQNTLSLSGGQLNNQQGLLASGDAMTVNSALLDNSHNGTVLSNGSLTLQASSVANSTGQIRAQNDLLLDRAQLVDNESGLIYSAQTLTLNAEKVVNQATRDDGLGIQGNNITLNADELNNSQGAVLADNQLQLTLGGQLDNSGGLISSLSSARLAAQQIGNEAGNLEAGSLLAVESEQLNGAGKLLSLDEMTLALQQDFTNSGTIQANGDLTLASKGKIDNRSLIQAGKTLNLTAGSVQNAAAAEISAATTVLNAGSSLVNYGLIDGFTTRINGNLVSNIGSGRIYGDAIAIQAGTLNNLAANGRAPVIAARQRLNIGAATINNYDHALIYSDGTLAIGGRLTADGVATGQGNTLNNHSATIESAGNMALNVRYINNINDHFELENVLVSQEAISEYEVNRLKNGVRYNDKDYTIYIYKDETYIVCIEGVICHTTDGDRFTHYQYTRTITEDRIKETDPAKIIAGGHLNSNAESVVNDNSQIVAGGMLALRADSLENIQAEAFRQINDAGTATAYSRHQEKGGDSPNVDTSDYVPPTIIQAIDLKSATFEEYTRADSSNPNVAGYQTAAVAGEVQGAGENNQAQIVLPAGKTFEVQMQSGESLVRVVGPNTSLPDNSLFKIHPQSTSHYLVETDPRFASQKQWLSSDYMMDAFASDPANVLKRLGDGYYEQKLIREQIIALTGQRYLAGQQSDEEQYKALMSSGIEFGKKYNLVPGVALTSAQMSLLTGDIVWLVTQTVRLADGSTQQVLVPQVYAVVKPGDLDGSGALLAAENIGLNLSGELTNSGRISSRQTTQIQADTLTNLGGQLRGNDLLLQAQTDINNIGGAISANNSLLASAGRDINATTTTRSAESEDGRFARTTLDSVAGFYVEQANGTLALQAGRDINLQAAQVVNSGEDGAVALSAGRDLNLTTVTTGSRDNLSWGRNYQNHSASSQVGTDIVGSGSVALEATRDINVTAGNLSAEQQLSLTAGNDISLQHAIDTATLDQYHKATGSNGALSSKTVETRDTFSHQTVNGSQISADSINIQAGHDLTVTGSSIAGTQDVALAAGNDLTVQTAVTRQEKTSFYKEKKSGISGTGGIGVTVGSSSVKTADEGTSVNNTGSIIGSTQGSVTLSAGNNLQVQRSDLVAGKDLSLSGKEVSVLAAENQSSQTHTVEQKQSGLTLALSGTLGSALSSVVASVNEAGKENSGRLAALQGVKAALSGVQAYQSTQLAEASGDSGSLIGLNLSWGSQSSKSVQTARQNQSQGSTLNAGNNLNISATGTDINIQGSQLKAGNDASLSAARDVNLYSAQNSTALDGKNESKGGSVGVGVNFGQGANGISLNASVNRGKGSETGNGTTHTETTLDAGHQVTVVSGRDTTLTGAQVSGSGVKMDVGRNLTLTSEQDTDHYDSKQQNASAGASISMGGGSAQVSLSRDKMHSTYESVQEQTGIFAGADGFDVTVGEHTQLDGAVIASTAGADKNRLDTGTLGFSDITNSAEYEVEHQSAGISTGGSVGGQFLGNLAGTLLTGVNGSDSAESTTKAAVSAGSIVIRDSENQRQDVAELSRDVEHANQTLSPIFDKEKEQQRLREAQLIGEIGVQVGDIARTQGQIDATRAASEKMATATQSDRDEALAALKSKDPTKQYGAEEIEQQVYQNFYNQAFNDSGFGTGGRVQQAISAATAAIQGLAGGDIATAVAGGAAPYIATIIKETVGEENRAANLLAHAAVNAAIALAKNGNAAAGAAGAVVGEAVGMIALEAYGKSAGELSETEKQTVSALATLAAGLAGGLIGDSTADTVSAAQAGKMTVENNALAEIADELATGVSQVDRYKNALGQLKEAQKELEEKYCNGLSADACSGALAAHRDELLAGGASFGADFVPVVGDIKSFAEAQSAIDYLAATVGLVPVLGDAAGKTLKLAQAALKKGELGEASKLINKASDEIAGYLPSPGNISLPSSGIGANAAFSINKAQLGKKLGKHVEDFGGNASNAADRQRVLDIINDIGKNPDKVIAGKFAGQGAGGGASRGDVFFRIKGNDVVVTKPDGSFVTILKNGINNTSVKNALKGEPK